METRQHRQFFVRQSASTLLVVYILHLLEERPRHGRAIVRELHNRFSGHWRPSHGTIYPLLSALEEDGYIYGSWNDARKRYIKTYRLTESGKMRLERGRKAVLPLLNDTEAVIKVAYNDLLASHRKEF